MNGDLEFQQSLIAYLERAHMGEFFTGTLDEIKQKTPLPKTLGPQGIHTILTQEEVVDADYKDPTQTMPMAPPPLCNKVHSNDIISDSCADCESLNEWWRKFESTVDDLIVHSNTHTCRHKTDPAKDNKKKKKKKLSNVVAYKAGVKGCLNDNDVCMVYFTLLHVVQLDSSGLQVISDNYLESTWSPSGTCIFVINILGLQMDFK